jgi:hypothetical protein
MGFRVSRALFVAAELGIADRLLDGPRSSDDLAHEVGADPDALYRLLRALARERVFEELDGRRFAVTELGRDLAGTFRAQALFYARSNQWDVWSDLMHSVRTGESAFEHLVGEPVWEWRATHAEESSLFDDWMTAMTLASNSAIVGGLDWGRYAHIVDVGGGHGALLGGILARHPGVRGVLFDQPAVVAGVESNGVEVVGGNFFESVPEGGDAYLLKFVLHDWDDEPAIEILRSCRRAARAGTALLVIERQFDLPATKFADLNMLVGPGGRERAPRSTPRCLPQRTTSSSARRPPRPRSA